MESGPVVTLVDGRRVCNYCPAWRIECEARHLLRMPLQDRRAALADREKTRGKQSVDELRAVMTAVHARGRK